MSAGGASPLGTVAVIWRPVRTLRLVAEERRALPGFVVVAANAALSVVLSGLFVLAT